MGISRDSGRLPFVADPAFGFSDKLNSSLKIINKYFQNDFSDPLDLGHGWTLQASQDHIDDIWMLASITKDSFEVFYTMLCLVTDSEPIFCAKKNRKADLELFLKDFGTTAEIQKNEKVIQTN